MSAQTSMVRLTGLGKRFVKGKETISIFDHLDLAIPQGENREVRPHGERTKHLHLCPPSEGRPLARRAPAVQGWFPGFRAPRTREMPPVASVDSPRRRRGPPQEGWDAPVLRSKRTRLDPRPLREKAHG